MLLSLQVLWLPWFDPKGSSLCQALPDLRIEGRAIGGPGAIYGVKICQN
jgi:hypothetical protein